MFSDPARELEPWQDISKPGLLHEQLMETEKPSAASRGKSVVASLTKPGVKESKFTFSEEVTTIEVVVGKPQQGLQWFLQGLS